VLPSDLARRDDYGVLTPRRLVRWIGALVLASAAIATLLGFVGAQRGIGFKHFDWSLAAVVGTAIGTVLLAGFTGALAWTTSGDVRATIRLADTTQEEQRARDRPTVAVRMVDVGHFMLDPAARSTVPVLYLWMQNVGNGPAIDLHLHALHRGVVAPVEEVVAVVAPGEVITDRSISLAGLDEPQGGFALEDMNVSGETSDRTGRGSHPIIVLREAGLPDQQRAARDAAAQKAWLRFSAGLHESPQGKQVGYGATVYNNGPREAQDVRVQLVDATGHDYAEPFVVGNIQANNQEPVRVVLPFPHDTMSVRLTWLDGRGLQSQPELDAYPALPARS